MHIHVSLVDKDGKERVCRDPISPLFRNGLGGLLRETMGDFMAIWAQSANAYRRYQPKSYEPMAAHWGFNNRTASLRVLNSSPTPRASNIASLARMQTPTSFWPRFSAESATASSTSSTLARRRKATATARTLRKFRLRGSMHCAVPGVECRHRNVWCDLQKTYAEMKDAERRDFERVVTALDHQWYARVA